MDVQKDHIRHCLLHYFHRKVTAAEARRIICETYGDNAVTANISKFWFKRFHDGDFDLSDKERSGRPQELLTDELSALLAEDSSLSAVDLAKVLSVDQSTVNRRLHAMGKVLKQGHWVPHELTEAHRERRFDTCNSLLSRQNKKSFLWKIVTGDEKWIYYDNPTRKGEWVDRGQATSSTPQRNIHGHKLLLCIWWDQKGVLYYELLRPNQTITAERYCQQLQLLSEQIVQQRPYSGHGRRPIILLHDNARPHTAIMTRNALKELKWEILPHPAYSPDIAPSDYHMFRSMQHGLSGTHFRNQHEVVNWVDQWIASKDQTFFQRGIATLPERWSKVVQSEGNYFQ